MQIQTAKDDPGVSHRKKKKKWIEERSQHADVKRRDGAKPRELPDRRAAQRPRAKWLAKWRGKVEGWQNISEIEEPRR